MAWCGGSLHSLGLVKAIRFSRQTCTGVFKSLSTTPLLNLISLSPALSPHPLLNHTWNSILSQDRNADTIFVLILRTATICKVLGRKVPGKQEMSSRILKMIPFVFIPDCVSSWQRGFGLNVCMTLGDLWHYAWRRIPSWRDSSGNHDTLGPCGLLGTHLDRMGTFPQSQEPLDIVKQEGLQNLIS